MKNVKTQKQFKQTFTQTGFYYAGSIGFFYTQKEDVCSLSYLKKPKWLDQAIL